MPTVKIQNNEARIHTIGFGYGETVKGAGTRPLQIRLLPGINEVDAAAWDSAMKLPVVQHYVETEVFKVVSAGTEDGLAHMAVKSAIAVVKSCLDRELLRKWASTEKRGAVMSAIEDQIDVVTFKPERDAPDAEGMDLKPTQVRSSMSGAMVADQVQGNVAEEMQRPMKSDPKDGPSLTPAETPHAISKQLRDVPEPKATKPARGR